MKQESSDEMNIDQPASSAADTRVPVTPPRNATAGNPSELPGQPNAPRRPAMYEVDLDEDEDLQNEFHSEEPKCRDCSAPITAGLLFCLACTASVGSDRGDDDEAAHDGSEDDEIQEQHQSYRQTPEVAQAVVTHLQDRYGIEVTWKKSTRGPYRTNAAKTCKDLRRYDRKAVKQGFADYEDLFRNNPVFRRSMLERGRDLNFRRQCDETYYKKKGPAKGGGKSRDKGKGKDMAKGSSAAPYPAYSKGWAKGATWAAAASSTWWSASGESTALVPKPANSAAVADFFGPSAFDWRTAVFAMLGIMIIIVIGIIFYEAIRYKVLKFFGKESKETEPFPTIPKDFLTTPPSSDDEAEHSGGKTPAPVVNRDDIYISPNGDCYHRSKECRGLRSVDPHRIAKKRACLICCDFCETNEKSTASGSNSKKTK